MEYQRRILGLLYIIGGGLFILTLSLACALLFAIPVDIFSEYSVALPEFVKLISLASSILLLLLLGIPSVIVGMGLLQNRSWAFDWILVVGCFYIIFFPVGTAIGIYALVVFFTNRPQQQNALVGQEKVVQ